MSRKTYTERDVELAWAAGLFEGEGCLFDRTKASGGASVQMTDRDVLERFARIMGFGEVKAFKASKSPLVGRKQMYYWQVQNVRQVTLLIAMLQPWLCERRSKRAEKLLERMAGCKGPRGTNTHCHRGHEFTPANTYRRTSGQRQCRTCDRERRANEVVNNG